MQFDRVTRGKVLGTGRQICTSHVQPPSKKFAYSPNISDAICVDCKMPTPWRGPRSESFIIASQSTNLCTLVYAISTIHRLRRLEFATENKWASPKIKRDHSPGQEW